MALASSPHLFSLSRENLKRKKFGGQEKKLAEREANVRELLT
jgi:hypothetical protein